MKSQRSSYSSDNGTAQSRSSAKDIEESRTGAAETNHAADWVRFLDWAVKQADSLRDINESLLQRYSIGVGQGRAPRGPILHVVSYLAVAGYARVLEARLRLWSRLAFKPEVVGIREGERKDLEDLCAMSLLFGRALLASSDENHIDRLRATRRATLVTISDIEGALKLPNWKSIDLSTVERSLRDYFDNFRSLYAKAILYTWQRSEQIMDKMWQASCHLAFQRRYFSNAWIVHPGSSRFLAFKQTWTSNSELMQEIFQAELQEARSGDLWVDRIDQVGDCLGILEGIKEVVFSFPYNASTRRYQVPAGFPHRYGLAPWQSALMLQAAGLKPAGVPYHQGEDADTAEYTKAFESLVTRNDSLDTFSAMTTTPCVPTGPSGTEQAFSLLSLDRFDISEPGLGSLARLFGPRRRDVSQPQSCIEP